MKKAILSLILIFAITAGIWYLVINLIDDEPARVVAMKYENTAKTLYLNSLLITPRKNSAFLTDKTLFSDNKIAKKTTIKLGRVLDNGKVEILEGIEDEDEVIVRTSKHLKNRMTVEIIENSDIKL